jgi:hypothetical protein
MLKKPNKTLKLLNNARPVIKVLCNRNHIRLLKSEHKMLQPAVVDNICITAERRRGVAIRFESETYVLCVGGAGDDILTCRGT